MTNKKNEKEKEDFDPDIHGGGVESFGTYTPPQETKEEKDKVIVSEDDGYHD